MTTYYTAYFLNPDGSGKPRAVRFGAEQVEYTFDRNVAFNTCQRMADETGEVIYITETRSCGANTTEGYFHKIRPTKNRTEV